MPNVNVWSSERHPSWLEDGWVATNEDRVNELDEVKFVVK